jgi:hypothetical protein
MRCNTRALAPLALGAALALVFAGCSGSTRDDASDTVAPDAVISPNACARVADGAPCDDADPCTVDDVCQEGACVGGGALDCGRAGACEVARCEAGVGCVIAPLPDGEACALACFEAATCRAGACEGVAGAAVTCPASSDPCVAALGCDPATGACVVVTSAAEGTTCDRDDDPCTLDACDGAGVCASTEARVTCAAESAADPCFTHACVAKLGCVAVEFVAGASCDDGDPCTMSDTCVAGEDGARGCAGAPVPIDDGDPCTADACVDGAVSHAPLDGVVCDDPDDLCVGAGLCDAGVCDLAVIVSCDDGDPCTVDTCEAATGTCAHALAPTGTACDDGDACTTADACDAGLCLGATVADCCGNGVCEAGESCACGDCAGESCDDGDACTSGDVCQGGACGGATVADCCGNGACEAGEGCGCSDCEGESCSDAGACVSDATCQGGACTGTTVADCCGNGACEAGEGCACADCEGAACEDGDPCTDADVCNGGACVAGPVDPCCGATGGVSVPCGPARRFVTAAGYDSNSARLVVLDAADGATLASFSSGVTGQGFDGVVASADGRWAAGWGTGTASSTTYGHYGFYDLSTDPPTKTGGITSGSVVQAIQEVVMLPGDRALGVSKNTSSDGGMVFVDLATGAVIARVPRKKPNYGWDRAKLGPDGRSLVAWSTGWPTQSALGYLSVFDVSVDPPVEVLHYDDSDDWPSSSVVRIQDAALTGCGGQLVVASEDLSVIDVATGQRVLYAGATDWLRGMAQMRFTDDEALLFVREWHGSSSAYSGYHVFDFSGGTPAKTHTMMATDKENLYTADIATIPGTHLGASAADMAAIWDLDTGTRVWGAGVDMNGLVRVTDDGARVLFVGENDYTTNVRVMNVEGASPTTVGSGTAFQYIGAAEVVPGTHRALLMGRSLYVLDLDTFTVEASWALPSGTDPYAGAAISCDGTRAVAWTAFEEYGGYRDVLNLTSVPATRLGHETGCDSCRNIPGAAAAP